MVIKTNTVGKVDNNINTVWKIFLTYLLLLFCLLVSSDAYSQITVKHFNAGWNSANDVEWFSKLKECDKSSLLIDKDDNQKKYQIAVVPTIIIFKDDEEVKRFQADLSFKMVATRKEIQDFIDELIMSDF